MKKRIGHINLEVLLLELRSNPDLKDLLGISFNSHIDDAEIEKLLGIGKTLHLSIEDFQTFINTVGDYILHRQSAIIKNPDRLLNLFN